MNDVDNYINKIYLIAKTKYNLDEEVMSVFYDDIINYWEKNYNPRRTVEEIVIKIDETNFEQIKST